MSEPRREQHLVSWYLAAIAYALTYTATKVLHLPILIYLPVERRWSWTASPGDYPMRYFGMILSAALVALLAWGVGQIPSLRERLSGAAARRVLVVLVVVSYALGLSYYLVHELTEWGSKQPVVKTGQQ